MSRKMRARLVALATAVAAVGLVASFAWLRNISYVDHAVNGRPAIVVTEPTSPPVPAASSQAVPAPEPAADVVSPPATRLAQELARPAAPSTPSRPAAESSTAPASAPALAPALAPAPAPAAAPVAVSPGAPALAPAPAPAATPAATPATPADRLAAGRDAFERLGCLRCHSIAGRGSPASPLDGIGQRRDPASIRDWVLGTGDAKGALSANVLRAKARAQGDPDLDALVDYLGQLGR